MSGTRPVPSLLPQQKVHDEEIKADYSVIVHPSRLPVPLKKPLHPLIAAQRKSARVVTMAKQRRKGRISDVNFRDVTLGDAGNLALKAWKGVKYLMEKINVESKMFDVSDTQAGVSWSGVLVNLSNIAEGSDYGQRTGISILAERLSVTRMVHNTSSPGSYLARLLIVRDKYRTSNSDPTASEILEGVGSLLLFMSPHNHVQDGETGRRFTFLHDEFIDLSANATLEASGTTNSYPPKYNVKHFEIKLNSHINYDDTAGADASDYSGALYAIWLSATAASAGAGPDCSLYTRLYFTDN